ncbi:MAG: alpha/beta fold hydrolase [Clostridiaceae bacterium]|nr:alpha/beta fold hydrolase [Clostridiaceae bacterium]
MRLKRSIVVSVVVIVMLLSSVSAMAAPEPKLINVNADGAEGDYYVGSVPAGYDPSKPVIVFVHGMGGNAKSWWDKKCDSYNYAYNSGYRTAFVNFRDADGNPGDMWRNGSVLSQQLQQICNYYKVSKVNLICHSKGGVDSTSAIAHYGANKYVDKVFTISSPHWGSPLADLCYTWQASWLAELMGHKNDATYVLQTSYMKDYRKKTDSKSEIKEVKYYTSAGTDDGDLFSSTWFGNLYLSSYGANDGVVLVESSKLPFGTHAFTAKYDHFSIRYAKNTWKLIEPYMRSYTKSSTLVSSSFSRVNAFENVLLAANDGFDLGQVLRNNLKLAPSNSSFSGEENKPVNTAIDFDAAPINKEQNNILLRGGEIDGSGVVEFPVEKSVKSIDLDFMASNSEVELNIISPDKKTYKLKSSSKDTAIFEGAYHFTKTLKSPKAGKWTVQVKSEDKTAYLMNVKFDSAVKAEIAIKDNKLKKGSKINLGIDVKNNGLTSEPLKKDQKIKTVITKSMPDGKNKKVKEIISENNKDKSSEYIDVPSEEGVYSISTDIKGTLEDGTEYERTVVKSIIVE